MGLGIRKGCLVDDDQGGPVLSDLSEDLMDEVISFAILDDVMKLFEYRGHV